VLVIRALVSCYYGALHGCESYVGPDSDTNETAAYPERPADNQVLQFVRRDATSLVGILPACVVALSLPEPSTSGSPSPEFPSFYQCQGAQLGAVIGAIVLDCL
jgi:hypothetical protein